MDHEEFLIDAVSEFCSLCDVYRQLDLVFFGDVCTVLHRTFCFGVIVYRKDMILYHIHLRICPPTPLMPYKTPYARYEYKLNIICPPKSYS